MTVITRRRAKELYLVVLPPRLVASEDTELERSDDSVVHHLKRGVSADNNLVRANVEHLHKELLRLGNSVENAV